MPLSSSIPEITAARYVENTEFIKFILPSMYFGTLEYMLRVKDPDVMKAWLCYVLGREFDAPRCASFNVQGEGGKLIVTLGFNPPWYESETSHQKYIEYGTLPNPRQREET